MLLSFPHPSMPWSEFSTERELDKSEIWMRAFGTGTERRVSPLAIGWCSVSVLLIKLYAFLPVQASLGGISIRSLAKLT
jgi:hypothetical protein